MKKTKKTKRVAYLVKTYVYASNSAEARRLAKKQEPHHITPLIKDEPTSQDYIDAYAFLELPEEWDGEELPEYVKMGYKKDR